MKRRDLFKWLGVAAAAPIVSKLAEAKSLPKIYSADSGISYGMLFGEATTTCAELPEHEFVWVSASPIIATKRG